MPILNGRYHANAQTGRRIERARFASNFRAFREDERGQKDSSARKLLDHLTQPHSATEPPPNPKPPGMPAEAYDHMKINELTVRQVANIVANENHDVTPGKSSPQELKAAKKAQAHAIINADRFYGSQRDEFVSTASKEVTAALENSPQYKQALDVARTAFEEQISGTDPIGGRMWFNNRDDASAHPRHMKYEDLGVYRQFGPFQNGKRTRYTVIDNNPKHIPKSREKT